MSEIGFIEKSLQTLVRQVEIIKIGKISTLFQPVKAIYSYMSISGTDVRVLKLLEVCKDDDQVTDGNDGN